MGIKMSVLWLGMVAYTCNLSYSGGRDQEDSSSRPAEAKS
jgi:hypothetical protein